MKLIIFMQTKNIFLIQKPRLQITAERHKIQFTT